MEQYDGIKVSVIVPVYKVESYLRQCLDSILAQTYHNLEIILVDDGSPDNCPIICDEYAEIDNRVKVIHKANGGLSDARNAGLDACTGDYIGFVDSDDSIMVSMYHDLLKAIKKYNADIAYCGIVRVDESMQNCLDTINYGNERAMSNVELLRQILSRDHTNDSVCNKLYNARIFQTIRFPLGRSNEDAAILSSIIEKAQRAVCTGTLGYYYRQRNGSIMHSGSAEYHMKMLHKNLNEMKAFIIENYPKLYKDFLCYDVNITTLMMSFFTRERARNNHNYKKLKHHLWKNLHYCVFNRNCRFKSKLSFLLFALGIFEPTQSVWYRIQKIIKNKNVHKE